MTSGEDVAMELQAVIQRRVSWWWFTGKRGGGRAEAEWLAQEG